jgi:hypothetical protein
MNCPHCGAQSATQHMCSACLEALRAAVSVFEHAPDRRSPRWTLRLNLSRASLRRASTEFRKRPTMGATRAYQAFDGAFYAVRGRASMVDCGASLSLHAKRNAFTPISKS